jgi:hypothetical protein
MVNTKLAKSDAFANQMNVNLNVLCPLMVHWVGRHVHGRDVVAEGHRHAVDGAVQLAEELLEPNAFGRSIGHCMVFGLHPGARHRRLSHAGPRHKELTEEDAVARH